MTLRTAILSAVTVSVAAFGLVGCSSEPARPAAPPPAPTTSVAAPVPGAPAPLPPPSALTEVLYRIADPAVPGAEKIGLVEQATAADTTALDGFGRALADNGYHPMTFDVADLAWSAEDPDTLVATVIARTPPGREGGDFSYPMEFTRAPDGSWQLTHETAELLFEIGTPATPTPPR